MKQKILEAALDAFYEKGFHACGVELLARQAGTTKRTLYAHFGSKEGLIEAVLDYRHAQFIQQLDEYLGKATGKQTIRAYLDFLRSWVQSEKFYGCLFINACSEFSRQDSIPHTTAQKHKRQILRYLQQRLNNQSVAELLFLYGEGIIVSAQTGVLSGAEKHETLVQWLEAQL